MVKPDLTASGRPRYTTPGPGSYNVVKSSDIRFAKPRLSSFSNSMCRYDRAKTGPLAESMRMSSTPGPDLYAMAGQQQLRVKHNSGTMKFGSEERTAEVGPKGPGPGEYKRSNYDVISAKGRVRAAPKFSFGGKNIRGKTRMGSTSTPDSVAPGSYRITGGIGRQTVSTRPSSPTWGMGSSSRDQAQTVCSPGYAPRPTTNNPGPGRYAIGQSVGKQVLSTTKSSPMFGQGSAARPDMSRKNSNPGPGMYRIPSAIKSQVESRRPTTPSWGFGTSQRPSVDEGLVG